MGRQDARRSSKRRESEICWFPLEPAGWFDTAKPQRLNCPSMPALSIRFHRGGVFLPSLGLWLDPHEPKRGGERVFISHAHSDHVAPHREVILSDPTSKLLRARLRADWQEHVLPFGKPFTFAGAGSSCRITLLPAGHVFGSSMALIEAEGESLLYTGDFKLRPSLSAERCEPRQADILIMETTYGRPGYRFPPAREVLNGVIRFCREALDNEETPVLLGYSLGKCQELLCGLADAGLPIMLHGSVHKLTRIYEQCGHSFPAFEKFESNRARGHVLVCPPHLASAARLPQVGSIRVAMLTGWAVDANCRYRYQAHAAFPLSDHADFPELLEMVRLVNPKTIHTLHGFAADFAQTLRDLGRTAHALSEDEQLLLPLRDPSEKPAAPVRSEALTQRHDSGGDQNAPQALFKSTDHPRHPPDLVRAAVSEEAAFHTFAMVCSRIGATPRKTEKTELLAAYLRKLDVAAVRAASTWFTGHPFPPSEGKVLQLGWSLLREALCGVTNLNHSQFGEVYLKHSDLGETAFELLLKQAPAISTTSLQDIAALFQQLHASRGPLGKLPLLAAALRQCTGLEGKYIVKILTGDLRIGLKEGLVEEGLAQAFQSSLDEIRNANLLLGNIGETAELACRRQLNRATLVPFRPLKFMLASPEETAAAVWQRVQAWSAVPQLLDVPLPLGPIRSAPAVWLEDKYDGIRCQLHKAGLRVALYSRDLKEITASFLEVVDAASALGDDFILDGELVAMRDGQALPFGELQKRLGRREADLFFSQQIPVQFIAFDLLSMGGQNCLDLPLRERRERLEKLWLAPLQLARITLVHSEEEIEHAFTEALARGNEGLMIKDPASAYSPGRRGLAWLKLKQATATLDCVVVGAEYGHGKRKDVLSDYTFAVRDGATGQLKTIGKAYSGLTDAEIASLTRHFLGKTISQHGRFLAVQPDTVLEIAFDILQPSDRHDSGLAMRFPRIVRVRTDKTPAEIDTLQTAWKLARTGRSGRGQE
jgi:DNA ligase 1